MVRSLLVAALCVSATPAGAQEALSLGDAIARALSSHPSVGAADAGAREASQRLAQARGGWLPRIDVSEGWMRGNQPVFVFGSLLNQRRFTEANFAIDALNHPDALSNHRLTVGLQQVLFDGFAIQSAIRMARAGASAAIQQRSVAAQELALGVTNAFGAVLRAEAQRQAAVSAVEAAEADLRLVQQRRDAGLATDADVLAVQVHLAEMRAGRVGAEGDLQTARAQLNELIGAPLDAVFTLTLAPEPKAPVGGIDTLESEALGARPELRVASLQLEGARAGHAMARAAFLPQAGLLSGWEFNGGSFDDRTSSWMVGAEVRVNLFRGGSDAARVAEARAAIERHQEELRRVEQQIRLDVRKARVRLESALARLEVGREAVARARESQRIVRDRYEAGLEDVTSLLRAAQAVHQAEALDIAARTDAVVAAAALDRALGRLVR